MLSEILLGRFLVHIYIPCPSNKDWQRTNSDWPSGHLAVTVKKERKKEEEVFYVSDASRDNAIFFGNNLHSSQPISF